MTQPASGTAAAAAAVAAAASVGHSTNHLSFSVCIHRADSMPLPVDSKPACCVHQVAVIGSSYVQLISSSNASRRLAPLAPLDAVLPSCQVYSMSTRLQAIPAEDSPLAAVGVLAGTGLVTGVDDSVMAVSSSPPSTPAPVCPLLVRCSALMLCAG
jgi:hypothetical protein